MLLTRHTRDFMRVRSHATRFVCPHITLTRFVDMPANNRKLNVSVRATYFQELKSEERVWSGKSRQTHVELPFALCRKKHRHFSSFPCSPAYLRVLRTLSPYTQHGRIISSDIIKTASARTNFYSAWQASSPKQLQMTTQMTSTKVSTSFATAGFA